MWKGAGGIEYVAKLCCFLQSLWYKILFHRRRQPVGIISHTAIMSAWVPWNRFCRPRLAHSNRGGITHTIEIFDHG